MSENYIEIQLDKQPIELYKVLKIADLVSGGGEAKVAISKGYVVLNGEFEYQKRKKIYHNDVIEFNGETIQIIINENLGEHQQESYTEDYTEEIVEKGLTTPVDMINQTSQKALHKKGNKKAVPSNESTASKFKRKPISF